jgi:hypothetical protein
LLLERARTSPTAKIIGLPSDLFHRCHPSRYEYAAHWILDHLILIENETISGSSSLEFSNGTPEQEVKDYEEGENEDDSIHSGGGDSGPQSYGTRLFLSRIPSPCWSLTKLSVFSLTSGQSA